MDPVGEQAEAVDPGATPGPVDVLTLGLDDLQDRMGPELGQVVGDLADRALDGGGQASTADVA